MARGAEPAVDRPAFRASSRATCRGDISASAEVQVSLSDPAQVLGLLLIGAGAVLLGACILEFARSGRGTLSPVDPPRHLVVRGLYRYVRNPMYLSVTAIVLGEVRADPVHGAWRLLGHLVRMREPVRHRLRGADATSTVRCVVRRVREARRAVDSSSTYANHRDTENTEDALRLISGSSRCRPRNTNQSRHREHRGHTETHWSAKELSHYGATRFLPSYRRRPRTPTAETQRLHGVLIGRRRNSATTARHA